MVRGLQTVLALWLAAGLAAAQAPRPEVVNAAIDRGMDFLLRSQNRDGSWGLDVNRWKPWDEHRDGPTSLALYALLRCGLRPDHPAARRAVAFLTAGRPEHTYSIGLELMALQALGEPALKKRIEALTDRDVRRYRAGATLLVDAIVELARPTPGPEHP